VCVSILALALVVMLLQRQFLVHLNKKKKRQWDTMSTEERVAYQTDRVAREADGNKRLDFLYAH
jgi:hypothetical protein